MSKPTAKPGLSRQEFLISLAMSAYEVETGWKNCDAIPLPLVERIHKIHHDGIRALCQAPDFSLAAKCSCKSCKAMLAEERRERRLR